MEHRGHATTRHAGRHGVQYLPRYCPFLKREVWAILVKQADGSWRIVNCLDKDRECFEENCAFTTDGGEWPFADGRQSDVVL